MLEFAEGYSPLSKYYKNMAKVYAYAESPHNRLCSLSTFRLGTPKKSASCIARGCGIWFELSTIGRLIWTRVCFAAYLDYLTSINCNWADGFRCIECGQYPRIIVGDGTNLVYRADLLEFNTKSATGAGGSTSTIPPHAGRFVTYIICELCESVVIKRY